MFPDPADFQDKKDKTINPGQLDAKEKTCQGKANERLTRDVVEEGRTLAHEHIRQLELATQW